MAMGRVYVAPTANSADIPSVLNSSTGGITDGNYWLEWTVSGFTNQGWFLTDSQSPLGAWWSSNHNNVNVVGDQGNAPEGGYLNTEEGLSAWITNERVTDLNTALGSWNNSLKWDFIQTHSLYNCMDA